MLVWIEMDLEIRISSMGALNSNADYDRGLDMTVRMLWRVFLSASNGKRLLCTATLPRHG